jgi:hypothetical protein
MGGDLVMVSGSGDRMSSVGECFGAGDGEREVVMGGAK